MNADISNQITLLMNVDSIDKSQAPLILADCSQVLNSSTYMTKLTNALLPMFSNPDFDFINDISAVITSILALTNNTVTTGSQIPTANMKYVIFGQIYAFLASQPNILKNIDLGIFRVIFSGCWSLLQIQPQSIQILEKTMCDSCMSCLGWYSKIDI